jgi:hypothetical protein
MKNLQCHTLHRMQNWVVDRGQNVPLPKPLPGGCAPGPLVTLCRTLSDFQIYCQIWFSSVFFGFLQLSLGDPNNQITKFLVIQVTRITK